MWAQSSQRATWPPRAAVRQLSIALITFNWPRLTWPRLVARHAGFGYDAFIVQRGEKIAALPAICALGKNTSWGTDIESRNVLFLPR